MKILKIELSTKGHAGFFDARRANAKSFWLSIIYVTLSNETMAFQVRCPAGHLSYPHCSNLVVTTNLRAHLGNFSTAINPMRPKQIGVGEVHVIAKSSRK